VAVPPIIHRKARPVREMGLPLRQFYYIMDNRLLNRFCFIALLEGISYLVLLGICMPLKYALKLPWAVELSLYAGWAHGLLFVLYGAFLIACWIKYKWSFGRAALVFFASLLPIAPFIVEKRLKKEAAAKAAIA
jgi:integral membrane protein